MKHHYGKVWAVDAVERAARAAAAAALGVITAGNAFDVLHADWAAVGSVAGTAALVSLLLSVAGGATGDQQSASFVAPPVLPVDENVPAGPLSAANVPPDGWADETPEDGL